MKRFLKHFCASFDILLKLQASHKHTQTHAYSYVIFVWLYGLFRCHAKSKCVSSCSYLFGMENSFFTFLNAVKSFGHYYVFPISNSWFQRTLLSVGVLNVCTFVQIFGRENGNNKFKHKIEWEFVVVVVILVRFIHSSVGRLDMEK